MAKDIPIQDPQHHFVLVHGAGHGAWCWYKLRTLFEASGHKVTCIDLKCSGIDPTSYLSILTFKQYNEPLITYMESLPETEKVVLVGHSLGGLNITDALYKFPQKVQVAVYLAANMMKDGYDFTHIAPQERDSEGKISVEKILEFLHFLFGTIVKWKVEFGPLPGVIVKPEYVRLTFYHMSPVEDSNLASLLLRPTPVIPLLKVQFEGDAKAVEQVPRVYIRTLNDQMMSQFFQQQMIDGWKPSKIFEIGSDHCAFMSYPDMLFRYLLQAAHTLGNNL